MLAAALLALAAAMAAFAPFDVDIRARGDSVWLILFKLGIGSVAMCAVMIVLFRMTKRRIAKDASEIQLTVAALALMAVVLGSWVLVMRYTFGT